MTTPIELALAAKNKKKDYEGNLAFRQWRAQHTPPRLTEATFKIVASTIESFGLSLYASQMVDLFQPKSGLKRDLQFYVSNHKISNRRESKDSQIERLKEENRALKAQIETFKMAVI